jgi:hypothetical protein
VPVRAAAPSLPPQQQNAAQAQPHPAAANDRPPPRRDRPPQQRRPEPNRGNNAGAPPASDPRRDPGQAFLRTGTVTLGDLLKAKLEQAAGPKKDAKDAKDAPKDKSKE